MDYLWLYETATLRLMLADAAHVREKCNDADARFIAHEVCLSIQREIVGRGEKL